MGSFRRRSRSVWPYVFAVIGGGLIVFFALYLTGSIIPLPLPPLPGLP